MPRPAPAQLAYGSVTVVCSTLAMLLLSDARSGAGIVSISVLALGLGLLVAMTAPLARTARGTRRERGSARATGAGLTAPRATAVHTSAEARLPQASLRP